MTYPELMILRHGQTEWNLEGRMQGNLDSRLTSEGVAQAQAQNAILKRADLAGWRAYSSPQGRAVASAEIAFESVLDEVTTDPDLVEIGVGEWAGQLRVDLVAALPASVALADGPDGPVGLYAHAPNGEGLAALRTRATRFLDRLNGPSIIMTHGITSRMLRAVVLNLPNEKLGQLPGGQGVIYHLRDRDQFRLD